MTDRFSLADRVALVTGASRGLGWAIARAFAESGALVILNGRDTELLESRAAELAGLGFGAEILPFDVADRDACLKGAAEAVARHGRLDILVNNAGITLRRPITEYPTEDWDRVLDVDLTSCFLLAREAAKSMVARRWGRVINVGSIMSTVARPTIPAYVAAKHGVFGLTKALAVELGRNGVTANCIAPGYIRTDINTALIADPDFDAMVRNRTPVGRWGEPEDIAGAALFLASDAGAYVNGILLTVDGGMTAALY